MNGLLTSMSFLLRQYFAKLPRKFINLIEPDSQFDLSGNNPTYGVIESRSYAPCVRHVDLIDICFGILSSLMSEMTV